MSSNNQLFDRGDVGFIILAGALVSFMVPGLAFLYTGLIRRKSALTVMWVVCASNAVVIFQWFLWGYSLAFSPTGTTGFIGDFAHIGLRKVMGAPSASSSLLPDLLFAFIQMQFATVTIAIIIGAVAERGRVLPAMAFSFLWVTFVYCPLACWAWNVNGWALKWGVVDFAGGGPVEIGSGVAGFTYSFVLGKRQEKELSNFRAQNVSLVVLGTWILWLGELYYTKGFCLLTCITGWVGFNGGSAYGANLRAVVAAWNTFICAAFAGVTWCLIEFRRTQKWTMVGFCSGTIAGLIAATPSSGAVPPWASIIIGISVGAICNVATKIKFLLQVDDTVDIFALHGIGGIVGLFANACFADSTIIALDNISHSQGGWINKNWGLLTKQFGYICACSIYTFLATWLILKCLDMTPGLHLRATSDAEEVGMDETEIGEFATDYMEVRRHFHEWNPPNDKLKRLSMGIQGIRDNLNLTVHSYPPKDRRSINVEDGINSHIMIGQLGKGPEKTHRPSPDITSVYSTD